jgi:HK97 family phage major capsid protein
MKKKYVRTAEGALILASAEQLADEKIIKFDVEIPDDHSETSDPIKELGNLIRSLSGDIKTRSEEMIASVKASQEAQRRGFPIFNPDGGIVSGAVPTGMTEEEAKSFFGHYSLAHQGVELRRRIEARGGTLDEAKRIEMAKFFLLFYRSEVMKDPRAHMKFWDYFGPQFVGKTAVGDTGNVFPLPEILEAEILAHAREVSVLLQYAAVREMVSEKQSFPAETGATSVGWGNTTSEHEPTISEVELDANELSAYSVVKNATLADTRSDIVSWLTAGLAEAAGQELDNQGFNGTGSPFYGLLGATNGSGYSVVLSGSSFSDITADDFSSMIAKLDGLKKQGARFFMNGAILHYVRTLKDDQSRPIFQQMVGMPVPGVIYGYPYSEVVKMTGTTGANTAFMVFGNLRFYAVGRRLDTASLSVDPYGLWTTNRTRFKLYQRWAEKVGLTTAFVRCLTST